MLHTLHRGSVVDISLSTCLLWILHFKERKTILAHNYTYCFISLRKNDSGMYYSPVFTYFVCPCYIRDSASFYVTSICTRFKNLSPYYIFVASGNYFYIICAKRQKSCMFKISFKCHTFVPLYCGNAQRSKVILGHWR